MRSIAEDRAEGFDLWGQFGLRKLSRVPSNGAVQEEPMADAEGLPKRLDQRAQINRGPIGVVLACVAAKEVGGGFGRERMPGEEEQEGVGGAEPLLNELTDLVLDRRFGRVLADEDNDVLIGKSQGFQAFLDRRDIGLGVGDPGEVVPIEVRLHADKESPICR